MSRYLRLSVYTLLVVLSLALYREWVLRTKPPLYLPLGFIETSRSILSPEEASRNPTNWEDPIKPIVVSNGTFTTMVRQTKTRAESANIVVVGATLSGLSASLSAAANGANVILIDDDGWRNRLLHEIALMITEEQSEHAPLTTIEQDLRSWMLGAERKHGAAMPKDGIAFFEHALAERSNINALLQHTITASQQNPNGDISGILAVSRATSDLVHITFELLIDSTSDGSMMALAGIATNTSWENDRKKGDKEYIPNELSEGYSMSGLILSGLGRRLDGALSTAAVIDRGYHGFFVPPQKLDECWTKDTTRKTAFIHGQEILRATSIGCTAQFIIEASYEDTVELFAINHGNDGLSASVNTGNTSIHVRTRANHADPFIYIGSFPISPSSPISLQLESILPIDRLEGLIVRKKNVHSGYTSIRALQHSPASFTVQAWNTALYDIHITLDEWPKNAELTIDDIYRVVEAEGDGTFIARNVPLAEGKHTLFVSNLTREIDVLVVPIAPLLSNVHPTLSADNTWDFTVPKNGQYLILHPIGACGSHCILTLSESGGVSTVLKNKGGNSPTSMTRYEPIDVVELSEGGQFSISVDADSPTEEPPIIRYLPGSADIYAVGGSTAHIAPQNSGGMYDIWIRGLRTNNATVSIGNEKRTISTANAWTYIGTEPLSTAGVSVSGGGVFQILAVPNTQKDAFLIPLHTENTATILRHIPAGNYSLARFGRDKPEKITFTSTNGITTSADWIQADAVSFKTDELYVHDGNNAVTVSMKGASPQRLLLYEKAHVESEYLRINNDALQSMQPPDAPFTHVTSDTTPNIASTSSGIFLLHVNPQGIGPVTIGSLHLPDERVRIKNMIRAAYQLLAFGWSDIAMPYPRNCDNSRNPTCDQRRFARMPWLLGTPDGTSDAAFYPDTRRLRGMETLTYENAYGVKTTCSECQQACVEIDVHDNVCISQASSAVPENAILSIHGSAERTNIASSQEENEQLIQQVFDILRMQGIIERKETYLEVAPIKKNLSLTLGMFIPSNKMNVLAGNTTISATHAASRALRSGSSRIGIGSVAGLVATFSIFNEHSSPSLIAESTTATRRLQRYLIQKGVTIMPHFMPDDDPMLLQAMQLRIFEKHTVLTPEWNDDQLTFSASKMPEHELTTLKNTIFHNTSPRTLRDVLIELSPSDNDKTDVRLLLFGLESGIIPKKMLNLSLKEVMEIPLDDALIMKAAYFRPPTTNEL